MEEKIRRLRTAFKNKNLPDPYKIEIWPTQLCNLNCKYCRPENYKPNQKEIPDYNILSLIDQASMLNVREFIIAGGGEPFVRKDVVFEMMGKIKKEKMKGSLTTNGTLLNEKDIKKIVEMGWDNIFFSIDGPNSKYNDTLRKKGSFEKALKNINLINHYKKKLNLEVPFLGISMVLTKTNYKVLSNMFKLAKNLRINCVVVNPIKGNNTDYNESLKLDRTDVVKLRKSLPKIKDYARKNNIQNTLDMLDTDLVERSSEIKKVEDTKCKCFEPYTSILINSFGGVGPCCERPDDENQDSIINNSLKSIWNGKYFNNIRKGKDKNVKCFYCNAWKLTDTEKIKSLLENETKIK
jgi:MoaA/NifB/PqqE/SkfB family radical SAM enzyme